MKKTIAIFISVLALAVIFATWTARFYNKMLVEQENTSRAWSEVDNATQRRSDLIPNLVQTVQAAGIREAKTLTAVAEARANASAVKIDASNISDAEMQKFLKAQKGVTSALSRLIAMKESYPQLKTSENFLRLQKELEATENRIAAARYVYNKAAQDYNTLIRKIPYNFAAMVVGFKAKPYFKADEGAQFVTKVNFATGTEEKNDYDE